MSALLTCLILNVNCAYVLAALCAAARYEVPLRLCSGVGFGILLGGTAMECAAVFSVHGLISQIAILVTFGAVVVAAACDAVCGYVFDAITIPCLILTAVVALVNYSAASVFAGALSAGGSLYLLHLLTKGRGLGLGDVKLACCIGACAGALKGLEALGIAFVLGGAYAAFLLVSKRARFGAELRFAPYLAAGMAIVMLHGSIV